MPYCQTILQQKEAKWTWLKTGSEKINYFFRVPKGHLFSKMVLKHCTLLAALNEFLHSEGHNTLLTLSDEGGGVQNDPLDTDKACIPLIFIETSQIFFWWKLFDVSFY